MLRAKTIYLAGLSCCSTEATAIFNSVYDIERLGYKKTDNLKNADIILIVGPTRKNELSKIDTKRQKLIAIGNCQIEKHKFNTASLGCPPRPETIISTILGL